jgi:hypothetical protein
MKKIAVVSILFLIIMQAAYSQDFYDIDTINTIEIIFAESNWNEILHSLYAAGLEERLVGTAFINEVQFDSVGVRYKGNSSYNPNQIKNPLNIKLDHIIEGQLLDGYGTLKLSNGFKDPSFVREVVSYEIGRKYLPSSKANYINVYINGDLIGLYTSVQSVDKFFMGNHFYCNDNAFFKGELLGPPQPVMIWGYYGPDSTSYYNFYEIKSDTGWIDLIEFLDTFNNNTTDVEEVLDVDRTLWMLAYDNLMVNLDSPINFGHNFYLYEDVTGQFNPILWDLNENFGAFTMLIGGQPLNIIQMQQLDPFLNVSNPNYPIINKLLPNPTYYKMYIAHMRTIMEENFTNNWFLNRVLEIQDIIGEDVQADPNKFYTYGDFLNNIYNSVGYGPQSIIGLIQLMNPRVDYLTTHIAFQGTVPAILDISYSPTNILPNSTVWFTTEVEDANFVILGYKQNIAGAFEKVEMFDDGCHNDGVAGDGIYGISIDIETGDIRYYIYAENDEAAYFSPIRAEYESYTIEVASMQGDLVINEFLASNDTTVADPHGEFDDWVELYNNSDETISLNGYYLSDDLEDLTKWTFPDTFIVANGYLIIWADDDEGQIGLHANFKLSASGESIVLTDPDLEIIDEYTFGEQTTDISMGRYPNGTGDFIEMTPTFAAENVEGIVGVDDIYPAQLCTLLKGNHPNPFNPTTTISYSLKEDLKVSLNIYNIKGQKVKTLINEMIPAGEHSVVWNGKDSNNKPVASGIYFYKLNVIDKTEAVKKCLLLK